MKNSMTDINRRISDVLVNELNLDKLLKLVSDFTSIPIEVIRGKRRDREIVFARHLYFYCAVNIVKKGSGRTSLQTIGSFVNKDHATVIHGVKTIQNLYDTDRAIRVTVLRMMEICETNLDKTLLGMEVKIYTDGNYDVPERKNETGVVDLRAVISESFDIAPGSTVIFPTKIVITVPIGFQAEIRDAQNAPGLNMVVRKVLTGIDPKEIFVTLFNQTGNSVRVTPLDVIAEMAFTEVHKVVFTTVKEREHLSLTED